MGSCYSKSLLGRARRAEFQQKIAENVLLECEKKIDECEEKIDELRDQVKELQEGLLARENKRLTEENVWLAMCCASESSKHAAFRAECRKVLSQIHTGM